MNKSSLKPVVTVAIRAYKHEAYIEQAIRSAMNQSYKELEIMVINDCSPDNTGFLVEKMAKLDDRIVYIKNSPNIGDLATANQIINTAKGKYIAWLDGDNFWLNTNKIEMQVNFLEANPDYALVGSFVEIVDQNGKRHDMHDFAISDKKIKQRMFISYQLSAPSVIFRTNLARQVGGFNPNYKYIYDLELWAKLGLHYKLSNIPLMLTAYRLTGCNISEVHRIQQIKEVIKLASSYRKHYPNSYLLARAKLYGEIAILSLPQPAVRLIRKVKLLLKSRHIKLNK